jgi:anti-sigma B factor antagonist
MELQVDVRTEGPVTILGVAGEVDLYTAPRLEEALSRAASGPRPRVVVNLVGATYLDSTALRVLTTYLRRIRQQEGEIALVSTHPRIAKIFSITGLHQLFPIFKTEGEALEKVQPHRSHRA